MEIERHTMHAILSGEKLQLKMRPGEFVYSFERANLPVYIGELLDVYIKAPAGSDVEGQP